MNSWKEQLEKVKSYVKESREAEEKLASEATIEEEIQSILDTDFVDEDVIEEESEVDIDEESMADKISKLFKIRDKKAIDGIANLMNMTSPKVLQSMQKQNPKGFERMAKKMGELPAMEEVEESTNETPEKTIEKLTERNMLGRLAQQLKLTKEGKNKLFNYFEQGELEQ
jgi:hypothetical protein